MRTFYLAGLAVVAASLAITAATAVPSSANVSDTARLAVDDAAAPAGDLMLSAVNFGREGVEPNTTGFTKTAAARSHGSGKPLELRPRQTKAPCPDPSKYAPGC